MRETRIEVNASRCSKYSWGDRNRAVSIVAQGYPVKPLRLIAAFPNDALKDFAPISLVAQVPNVLIVHPSLPVKNVKELAQFARARPGKLSFGSGGVGSSNHLASELFKSLAKVGIESVTNTPAEFANFMRGEVARWARVIREAKIQVE